MGHNVDMKDRRPPARNRPANPQAKTGFKNKRFSRSPEAGEDAKKPQSRPFRGIGSTGKPGAFNHRFRKTDEAGDRPTRSGDRPVRAGKPGGFKPRFQRTEESGDRPVRAGKPGGFKPRFQRTEESGGRPARAGKPGGFKPRFQRTEESGDRPARSGSRSSFTSRIQRDDVRKPFGPRKRFGDDRPVRDDRAPRRETAPAEAAPPAPARAPLIRAPYLYGLHAVAAAWRNPKRTCRRLLITDNALPSFKAAIQEAERLGLKRPDVEITDKEVIETALPKGSVHQGIVLEVEPLPEIDLPHLFHDAAPDALVMVLDQVTDPHNIGAILRSCAVFGVQALIVPRHNAPEISPLIAKTATGALEHVPVIRVANLSRALVELAEAGFWRVGLDEHAEKPLSAIPLSGKIALVMGSEGGGMRKLTRESCDHVAQLPASGPLLSLNVSNAAAIALYEARRPK